MIHWSTSNWCQFKIASNDVDQSFLTGVSAALQRCCNTAAILLEYSVWIIGMCRYNFIFIIVLESSCSLFLPVNITRIDCLVIKSDSNRWLLPIQWAWIARTGDVTRSNVPRQRQCIVQYVSAFDTQFKRCLYKWLTISFSRVVRRRYEKLARTQIDDLDSESVRRLSTFILRSFESKWPSSFSILAPIFRCALSASQMLEQVYRVWMTEHAWRNDACSMAWRRRSAAPARGEGEKKERESTTRRTGVKETAGWTRRQRSEQRRQGRTKSVRRDFDSRIKSSWT